MTLTLACVPISSMPSPPWPMTTKLLPLSGMMWSSTANSMAWRTSKCVLLLPSQPFVHMYSIVMNWTVQCGSSLLLCVFLPHMTYWQERQLENSAVSRWVELWLLRVRTYLLLFFFKNFFYCYLLKNYKWRGLSHSTRFSIFILGFLPW